MNARIVYQIVDRFNTAVALAKFAAIDLTPDLVGWNDATYGPPISICDDATAEDPPGSGIIKRTVKILYSPEFEQTFPTWQDKKTHLGSFGLQILRTQLPGHVEIVAAEVDYEANDCPP
jgi:hypothetical protein